MAKGMEKAIEVSQSLPAVPVGLAWANGMFLTVPLLSSVPEIGHTILGYAVAVGGVVGVVRRLMK